MIKHIRRGHHGTKLAPKYRGRYGEAGGNKIWLFQRSAISALLFIIHSDDMMEDTAALNRRSKLQMGIIQDMPHGQNKKLLWGEIEKRKNPMEKSRKHAQSAIPQQTSRRKKDAK